MESRDLICQWCNLNGVNLPAVVCIECECKWKCHRLHDAASHQRTIWCTKLVASMTLHILCKFISQIIISHTAFGHSYVHLSLHINNNNICVCLADTYELVGKGLRFMSRIKLKMTTVTKFCSVFSFFAPQCWVKPTHKQLRAYLQPINSATKIIRSHLHWK